MSRTRWSTPARIAVWVAMTTAVIVVVAAAFHAPFTYDEGYNLQVVKNLALGRGYASDGPFDSGTLSFFDPRISTGPTMLGPMGLIVWGFGAHPWVFRIVPVVAYVALLALGYRIGRRLGDEDGGWATPAAMLAISTSAAAWPFSPLMGAGDVLGEFMAAALMLAAVLQVQRPWLAGSFLGLAIVTKFIALLALPGFVLALLWPSKLGSSPAASFGAAVRQRLPSALALIAASAVPTVVWLGVELATTGWTATVETQRDFMVQLTNAGSGIGRELAPRGGLLAQLELLRPLVPAAVVVGTLTAVIVASTWVVVLGRSHDAPETRESAPIGELAVRTRVALVASGSTFLVWWLCISSANFVRHVVPGLLLLVPPVICGAVSVIRRVRSTWLRNVLALGVACALGAGVVNHAIEAWNPPGPSLEEQIEVAHNLANVHERLGTVDAAPAFELDALGDFTFVNDAASPLLVISKPVMWRHPGRVALERHRCLTIVVETPHYLGCLVAAPPS